MEYKQNLVIKHENSDSSKDLCRVLEKKDIFLHFSIKFLKVFSIKAVTVFFLQRKLSFANLLSSIFTKSGLKISMIISCISLIRNLLNYIIFKTIGLKQPDSSKKINILSAILGSLIPLLCLEGSETFKLISLMIFFKVLSNFLGKICRSLGILQSSSRIVDYLTFLLATLTWCFAMFYNPKYKAIPNTFAKYGKYDAAEIREFDFIYDNMALV